ncbi:hypothetical protein PPSIR1_16860 [Plesiocystis pacifica SIR-1]|uniref:Uncharacterized protein n=1 Tax=Plesiocystis pacifica SIR-1 TaxID=391625 RepID=A6GJA2_9BACT|nr:hypothetical protein [Plesiocystis pacifica]EDM74047.1 hypothetical protein PPSIR1_16860 [Plesiocystis pacifica SIR-1]
MGIITSASSRELGWTHQTKLASLTIAPTLHARGGELSLAIEIVNRCGGPLGVDFGLAKVGGFGEAERQVVAHVGGAISDEGWSLLGGIRPKLDALVAVARARFALGTNLFRVPAGGRLVVHTEPFSPAVFEAVEARSQEQFALRTILKVAASDGHEAELLADDPLVALPTGCPRTSRPEGARVLSPAELLGLPLVEREAELAQAPERKLEPARPGVRGSGMGTAQPKLELTGFDRDSDALQPLHRRALDELRALLEPFADSRPRWNVRVCGRAASGGRAVGSERAQALARRRAERVCADLDELTGLELHPVVDFPGTAASGEDQRSVEIGFMEAHPFELEPMCCHAWPGLAPRHHVGSRAPLLAAAWGVETLELAALRRIRAYTPAMASLFAPERLRPEVGLRVAFAALLDAHADRGLTVPRVAWHLRFLRPFGEHLVDLVNLLFVTRCNALSVEEVRPFVSPELLAALALLVDPWQLASERGQVALLDRLGGIGPEDPRWVAVILAVAERCVLLELFRPGKRGQSWASTVAQCGAAYRVHGIDPAAGSEARLAAEQGFFAATLRPELSDLLAHYEACARRWIDAAA